ncbi:methylmalonyl Co-A mutase-associated GTPase MeaB [Aquiflexum sp. LQ15W]|uniref:methylmalonyl Co-A mutase-associated GTPase MeaB n=1 Tax=Cognataquiflexum nitidum TaxID=2922272 RepID=UPI001F12B59B|nr:methylmalonyl Co-A mutase-associated GTPase MeaB [Cognataquiflexum nitidum]MCH6198761.1 methylmalonyl Co-A mutase-associated GTPase MeaB [Cognataquiflexum nitidum]
MAKNRLSVSEYIQGVLHSDRVILSRAITLVESTLYSDQLIAEKVMEGILPYSGNSIRIGITGVPGVGKSTFIESFGKALVDKAHKVAVLAVDPSSQQSHGSILGDKTRMENLASDKRAYIRPSPAGSNLGGVSARTREGMLLCEAAGFDVILIETVGVGQSEIAVKGMVDFFLLLMLAGAGDELQGIKKGIIEICDAMVINKADGVNQDAAKNAQREYANALHLFPEKQNGWIPQVKTCSAVEKTGLDEILEMIMGYRERMLANGYWDHNRSEQRINWLHEHVRYLLEKRLYQNEKIKNHLDQILPDIRSGRLSAIAKARELVDLFTEKSKGDK